MYFCAGPGKGKTEVPTYPQAAFCALPCAKEGCGDVCSCRSAPIRAGIVQCLVSFAHAPSTPTPYGLSRALLTKTKNLVKEGEKQWKRCHVKVDNEQTSKDYRTMVDAFWNCLITRACMAFMEPPLSEADSAVAWEPLTKFKVVTRVPLATFTQPTHATSAAHTLPNTLIHCHAPYTATHPHY